MPLDTRIGGDIISATAVLTIIIPTLNECENVEPLLAVLAVALPDIAWEAIFVDDDSRDGTAKYVRTLARRRLNTAFWWACRAELPLFRANRLAGLTAFIRAAK